MKPTPKYDTISKVNRPINQSDSIPVSKQAHANLEPRAIIRAKIDLIFALYVTKTEVDISNN